MKKVIMAATLTATLAAPAAASACMHASPGETWKQCGRVEELRLSVVQPGTSCGLGRNVMHRVLAHSQSPSARVRRQTRFSVRAWSPVTHRYHRVQVNISSCDVGFWNDRDHIAGSGFWG